MYLFIMHALRLRLPLRIMRLQLIPNPFRHRLGTVRADCIVGMNQRFVSRLTAIGR